MTAHPDWWLDMPPEERVIHYNRNLPAGCNHKADIMSWPSDLRAAFSFDPYFHTSHMDPCARWGIKPPGRWSIPCDCQMCNGMIGIPREEEHKVNEYKLREKLKAPKV